MIYFHNAHWSEQDNLRGATYSSHIHQIKEYVKKGSCTESNRLNCTKTSLTLCRRFAMLLLVVHELLPLDRKENSES